MRLTIPDIAKATAEYYGMELKTLLNDSRAREYSWPRHLAMHLCTQNTGRSLLAVGQYFGRDHTTVVHANREVRAKRYFEDDYLVAKKTILDRAGEIAAARIAREKDLVAQFVAGVPYTPPPDIKTAPALPRRKRAVPVDIIVPNGLIKQSQKSWYARLGPSAFSAAPEKLRAGRV